MKARTYLTAPEVTFLRELARGEWERWLPWSWMRDNHAALDTLVRLGMIRLAAGKVSITETGLAKLVEIALTE